MSGTTRSPAKKSAARAAVSPVSAVESVQEVELPEEVKLRLDIEQQKLEIATMQAQLSYLSGRVSELVQENYTLQSQVGEN